MVPESTSDVAPAGWSHPTSSFLTFGEPDESNRRYIPLSQDRGGPTVPDIYDMPLERFYCEEYDCGRVFSSEAHLKSHTRFFHPTKVSGDFTPTEQ